MLSELTADPELIAVWCANWGDYSLPPSRSSFAMHCMLNKHYLNGASYPTGGGLAFARAIEPIVAAAGGAIVHSAQRSSASSCAKDVQSASDSHRART